MKPIKLVMSAFGPYKNKVVIDFEKLGNQGVFLITGDTGSGKTTIFDGISFALFGSASGSRRENTSFRSDFANDAVKTYVDFTFEHKEVIYRIERVPRYMRKKIRGEGMTTVGGDASLVFVDKVVTGDRNVTDKCVEILGINAHQFRQIAMIAQGEFLELLLANPKERADIFRKIFDTGIYKDISERLKDRYLVKKREYEDLVMSMNGYIENIIWEEDRVLDGDNVLNLLELEINQDRKKEGQLKLDKVRLNKELEHIIGKISRAKVINDSFDSLEESQILLEKVLLNKEDMDYKKGLVHRNQEILEKVLPKLKEVSTREDAIQEKRKLLVCNEKKYQELLNVSKGIAEGYRKLDKRRKNIERLQVSQKEYEEKLVLLEEIEAFHIQVQEKELLFDKIRFWNKTILLQKISDRKLLMDELQNLKINFAELQGGYRNLNQDYVYHYNLFLSAQASVLASNLKENCPCPVCGSLVHPDVAEEVVGVLSREELEDEKNDLERMAEQLENLSSMIKDKNIELEILNKELGDVNEETIRLEIEKFKNHFQGYEIDNQELQTIDVNSLEKEISGLKLLIHHKLEGLQEGDSKEKIEVQLREIHEKIGSCQEEIESIQKNYEEYVKDKTQLESIIYLTKQEISDLARELQEKEVEYKISFQDLGYDEAEDYLKVQLDNIVLDEYIKEIQEYDNQLQILESKVSTLKEITAGKERVDLNFTLECKCKVENEINEIDMSLKNLNHKLSSNTNLLNKIRDVSQKTTKLENEVIIYKDLSDTANGNIKGKNKLEFEQFVQASYFDVVIRSANERLKHMTEERYELVRKEESLKISDQLGLELEVMDYYTGKKRDIKTLSGGESFKAALSLALGMSDTIMSYSGGVVVDTMFIDEGFGSLDRDSLEQALNVITMLSQETRMIGIISHVDELRARIDKKIVVKKSNCGSSIEIVV